MRRIRIPITTDGAGAATVYSDVPVSGEIIAFFLDPGTIATGGDYTITDKETGAAILTITNGGTTPVWKVPAIPVLDQSGAAVLYAAGGTAVTARIPVAGTIKCVVAQGGAGGVGTLWAYVK